jgi:hypothetical protein
MQPEQKLKPDHAGPAFTFMINMDRRVQKPPVFNPIGKIEVFLAG